VQRDDGFPALPGILYLVVRIETPERFLKGMGVSSSMLPTLLTSGFLPEKT
jgi:hypothetical protein